MHYVFKSKADADLIMMEPAGDQILRILGREPSRQGIIEATAMAAAMRAIEDAVAAEAAASSRSGGNDDKDESSLREPRVGLAQRAWPLLEMMKRSLAERSDIVWGV
ncbi:MAG: DUF1840 domain-containing protein [Caldimonas sp.]